MCKSRGVNAEVKLSVTGDDVRGEAARDKGSGRSRKLDVRHRSAEG